MNRFDLCVLIEDIFKYSKGTYAIILDMDEGIYYHLELWNFDEFDGAEIEYIDKKYLRIATEKEIEEYKKKFKEYCERNESP